MLKWIVYIFIPISLSVLYYFPLVWSLAYLLIISVCLISGVFAFTLWAHLALSSPHHTSLFLLDNLEKEVRVLDTAIRVTNTIMI